MSFGALGFLLVWVFFNTGSRSRVLHNSSKVLLLELTKVPVCFTNKVFEI